MNKVISLLAALGVGILIPMYAQTGPTVAAPAVSAAPQAAVAPRKTQAGSQKNRAHGTRKPAAQDQPASSGQVHRGDQPRLKPLQHPAVNYSDAVKRQHHERRGRSWWKSHYTTIVFVTGHGYYYWDAGYWFPAFGYDPRYENYDYNGPIFTYGNLLPDQVIYNVQRALKELGYYSGPLTGSLGSGTIAAIAAFQEDNGLDATGAIDDPTVEALGLY
jgi:hypothetical protein